MDGLPTTIEPSLDTLAALCERCHVRTLDLFGSAVTDHFDPERSDLDFLVRFEERSRRGFEDDFFVLHEALEKLFERPIDLVELQAIRNPYFRRHVLANRRRLFPLGMISQEAAKYVWDAKQAADDIATFTAARTFNEYANDRLLQMGVERGFEVLGEAFARLRRIAPETAAEIPGLPQAVAFRNIIAHRYDTLDLRRIWDVVQIQLDPLRDKLRDLLNKAPYDE